MFGMAIDIEAINGVLRTDYARAPFESLPQACRSACCAGSNLLGISLTGDGYSDEGRIQGEVHSLLKKE